MRRISSWKKWAYLLVGIFFIKGGPVNAADLTLIRIGTFSTAGINYSVVDYVGGIPTLEGTASPSAQVAIKIKTVTSYTTAATSSGIWQFVPPSLDAGTNSVLITSGANNLSFTLNFNSIATPTATPTKAPVQQLPESGVWENLFMIVIAGIAVIFLGKYVEGRMQKWEGKKK